ncbi:MAG: 2-isopropylmalate synthase [Candidatus Omnitrophica bacterium]|nr:2-isopropylmalate synthase [Candidatus Omnitrophota bacterium]
MSKQDKVIIFDTTLRDGEQAPGASMNQREKMEVALALERMGVDIIEAGFPVISKGDFESVQMIARKIKTSSVAGLARSIKKDIEAAGEALKSAKHPRIHVFLATSKIHLEYKLKKTPDEIVQMAVDSVTQARKLCADVEFSPEDASRSEKDFLYRVLEAVIKAGARTVNIPDTVGYAMPEQYGKLIVDIRNNVPNIHKAIISVHCHNDLGLAVANSLAAVKNGARQVECTINGIGERAGNASMEEIVMALRTRQDFFGCSTGIKTTEISRTSRLVSKFTGFAVAPNKAIVGANAFRHESGIHQDGVLKEPTTYEIMRPEDVGFSGIGLVLGKHSGRHALKARLKQLGIELNDAELVKAFERFKDLCDKKKEVFDEDLIAIVEDQTQKEVKDIWILESLAVKSGTHIKPEVEVKLKSGGKSHVRKATGDGPIDACYVAIDEITGLKGKLLNYGIQSVTQGKDAQGEVRVRVNFNGQKAMGIGMSTDVIEASVKAYLNAVNKTCAALKSKTRLSEKAIDFGLQP